MNNARKAAQRRAAQAQALAESQAEALDMRRASCTGSWFVAVPQRKPLRDANKRAAKAREIRAAHQRPRVTRPQARAYSPVFLADLARNAHWPINGVSEWTPSKQALYRA